MDYDGTLRERPGIVDTASVDGSGWKPALTLVLVTLRHSSELLALSRAESSHPLLRDLCERVVLAEHMAAGMERPHVLDENCRSMSSRLSMPCAGQACENAQVEQKCSASPSSATVLASVCGKTGRLTTGLAARLDRARKFHRDAATVEIAIEAHRYITQQQPALRGGQDAARVEAYHPVVDHRLCWLMPATPTAHVVLDYDMRFARP